MQVREGRSPGSISGWVHRTDGSDVDLQQSRTHTTLGYTAVLKTLVPAVGASAHHHTHAPAEGSARAPVPVPEGGLCQQPHFCDRSKFQGRIYQGILTFAQPVKWEPSYPFLLNTSHEGLLQLAAGNYCSEITADESVWENAIVTYSVTLFYN